MYSFLKPGVEPDAVDPAKTMIPRKLWQTIKDRHNVAAPLQACMNGLQAMNPGWEHHLFDDETQHAFLSEVCSDRFMQFYNRIQPAYGAARADVFRYVLMFLKGGAYFDVKSGVSRPLDEILQDDDEYILSLWDNAPDGQHPGLGQRPELEFPEGEFQQWFIIARPGHPYLKAVIEHVMHKAETYNPFVDRHGGRGLFNVMGPNAYTRGIHSVLESANRRHVIGTKIGIEYSVLDGPTEHRPFGGTHYSTVWLPPVTSKGLPLGPKLRWLFLEALYFPLGTIRTANYRRLDRRKARRFVPSAQSR